MSALSVGGWHRHDPEPKPANRAVMVVDAKGRLWRALALGMESLHAGAPVGSTEDPLGRALGDATEWFPVHLTLSTSISGRPWAHWAPMEAAAPMPLSSSVVMVGGADPDDGTIS